MKKLLRTTILNLPPAQDIIVKKLLKGDKIVVVNAHRMSGGEYTWLEKDDSYLRPAGKIYKAFWGIFWTIKKKIGMDLSASFAFDKNKNKK